MANEEKTSKKKWPLAIIAFIVVLVIMLLLVFRSTAEAQAADSAINEKISVSVQNMRFVGLESSAKIIGRFEDRPDALDLIKSTGQPLFYFDGAELYFRTLEEAAAETEQPEEFIAGVQAQIEERAADLQNSDSWLVEYYVGGTVGYVLFSEDTVRSAGVLSDMSRIAFQSVYPNDHPNQAMEQSCTFKGLTRNIFGQTAESVRLCVEAACQSRVPQSCNIYEKATRAWLFGSVSFNPDDLPESGQITGGMCQGRGYYRWSVGFQGLEIFGHSASIPGLEFSQRGTVTSIVDCAP